MRRDCAVTYGGPRLGSQRLTCSIEERERHSPVNLALSILVVFLGLAAMVWLLGAIMSEI